MFNFKKNWYKEGQVFGTDPFGSGTLSDKSRTQPWGNVGGDSKFGLFEPSSGPSHANDYFSESDKTPSTEKRLEDLNKKKKKIKIKKKKIKANNWYRESQFQEPFNDDLDRLSIDSLINICTEIVKTPLDPSSTSDHKIIGLISKVTGLLSILGKQNNIREDYFKNNKHTQVTSQLKPMNPDDIKTIGDIYYISAELYNVIRNTIQGLKDHFGFDLTDPNSIRREFSQNMKNFNMTMDDLNYKEQQQLNYGPSGYYEKNVKLTAFKKKSQWGEDGPKMPTWGGGNWVTQTYNQIMENTNTKEEKDKKLSNDNSSNNFQGLINSTVTIQSVSGESSEIGTGFFIGSNIILTCAHVALPNNHLPDTKILIRDGEQEYSGNIWAYDLNLDVAAIIINEPKFKGKKYLKLANSSEVSIGEDIVIVGTPLGFENVVATGIVSSAPVEYQERDGMKQYMFISSNILPGNSGGPVIKKSNQGVIGLAAAVISETEGSSGGGLSAIVPIDKIKPFLKQYGIKFDFIQ